MKKIEIIKDEQQRMSITSCKSSKAIATIVTSRVDGLKLLTK